MAEVASHNLIDRGIDLGREAQELILEGIDRVKTAFGIITVLRGKLANGEDHAIVLGVDQPLELFAGDDESESEGFLSKLRNNPLARLAGGVALAAGAAVGIGSALGGCNTNPDSPNQPAGIYGTQTGALTADQVLNIGPGQQIPWSLPGDLTSNYGEMNGKKYIFAGRNNSVAYVECQAIEDCLTANANQVKTVQGLFEAGMGTPFDSAGIFIDANGISKFIVADGNGWPQKCDISENANQTLEISNCAEIEPPMGASLSIYPKNGADHVQWTTGATTKERNMQTGVTQNLPVDGQWGASCGVGFEAGNVVVASQKQVIQGVTHCRIVTGTSWADLANNLVALDSLNNGPNGSTKLKHPRIMAGNIMVYAHYNAQNQSYLWSALIPDPPQPPVDAGAPDAGQPIPDAGQPIPDANQPDTGPDAPPIVDAGPAPDAQPDPGDVAQDITDAGPDLPPPPVDAGPDTPPPTPDAGPDIPPTPDTEPTPDAQPDPCSFAKPKVNIQPGCQLENCADPSADITGKCTFSVDLGKAKPVVIELDGTYQIDLLEKIGAHLSGKYKVVDNGNGFNTVAGSFGTGVEGTTYSGEFMVGSNYLISCQEGTIKVFFIKANGEKELLAILDSGEEQIFDMNNPQPEPEPNPEPTPDAGQPQHEPEKDTGSTQPEPTPTIDAGTNPKPETPQVPSKPPSNDGGCNATGNLNTTKNPNSTGHLATLALALMALGAATRRKREQQALKPSSILTRTWNRVARSLKSLGLRR